MGRLDGKVTVITGAASGIGRAIARRFAEEGAALVLGDIQVEAGEAVAATMKHAGATVRFLRTDVARSADVEALVGLAVSAHGRLDVMVNNAGIEGRSARVAETPDAVWDQVVAVNLTGVFYGIRHALAVMIPQGGGSIISTASVAGLVGWHGGGAYGAAKAGVVSLTRTAAIENARYGIRINCICPGLVETPMLQRIIGNRDTVRDRLVSRSPFPRLGQPEDIANAALYLASDEAGFVTGIALPVDGGYIAQ